MTEKARFSQVADEWKQDADFRSEYERIGATMELAFGLGEARRIVGVTQAEVARRMGTSQAAVARLESGNGKPNWETVERDARALGRRAVVTLQPIEPGR